MKLYSYFRSSAAYRVRIALNLKGLDHDVVGVNLLEKAQRDPDYLGVNPMGLVPRSTMTAPESRSRSRSSSISTTCTRSDRYVWPIRRDARSIAASR